MATVDVYNWDKKKVGSVELAADIFEAPVRKDILHSIVRWQLMSRRQGTHKAKTRAEVRGGGKKPFKQKGTGNARQGSTRSPLNEGGGITFGPRPRSYSYSIPVKVRKLAMRSALSHLLKEGRLFVVENMESTSAKTKDIVKKMKAFGVDKTVFVDTEMNDGFSRGSRNLPNAVFHSVGGVNVYDLLKYDAAILSKDSVAKLEQRCGTKD